MSSDFENETPLISVIIPIYNAEKYLDRCVSSAVNQSFQNLEILLIDDGSTDRSGAMCDNWQKRDERIRVCHKKNEGPGIARNTGVKMARGGTSHSLTAMIGLNLLHTKYL